MATSGCPSFPSPMPVLPQPTYGKMNVAPPESQYVLKDA
jgi:hypothetical protein